jgi:hypothetical protein
MREVLVVDVGAVMTSEEIHQFGKERLIKEIEFVNRMGERCSNIEVLGMVFLLRQVHLANLQINKV